MSNRTRRIWWVTQQGSLREFKPEPVVERGDRRGLAKRREEGIPGKEMITHQDRRTKTRGAQTGERPATWRDYGGCWGGGPRREGGQAMKGFAGNFLLLISGNGEPLWILEQRKTVFSEDNSSSCVEDGREEGRQGSQPESCTRQ